MANIKSGEYGTYYFQEITLSETGVMMDVSEETRLLNGTILTSRFFCSRLCQRIRGSKKTAVAVMFIAFMLDLMLLTVVGKSILIYFLTFVSDFKNACASLD